MREGLAYIGKSQVEDGKSYPAPVVEYLGDEHFAEPQTAVVGWVAPSYGG